MKKTFILWVIALIVIALNGCNNSSSLVETTTRETEESITTTKEVITTKENIITHTQDTILTGTIWETEVHYFESNIEGPKVTIVGGIHGDELAGWNAALRLLEKEGYFIGTVMIIPKANIQGCNAQQRYPGMGEPYNGYTYHDLNRNFPGVEDGNVTQRIAFEIVKVITEFEPDHVIDLHESRHSYSYGGKYIGNQIIYGNGYSSVIGYDIVDDFNTRYLKEGEEVFCVDTYAPGGSFNSYFGALYKKACVFTIETNRELELSRRIEQQLELLDCMFNYFWNKI